MTTKAQVRSKIFSADSRKLRRIKVSFFGSEIEIQQPSLTDIMKMSEDVSGAMSIVNILIEHAYVPGTQDKVFDEADRDQLKSMPYSADFGAVLDAIQKLSNIDIEAAVGN